MVEGLGGKFSREFILHVFLRLSGWILLEVARSKS